MKKRHFLPLLQRAFFLFISLLLQNCGRLESPPIQGEQESTETIEQEGQISLSLKVEEQPENNPLPAIMPELWQYIFSYLDFEGVLAARSVSADWNGLITGYKQAGIVGVENKPSHIIDIKGWTRKKEISFYCDNLDTIKTEAVPSFAFYCLMGEIRSLPQEFWPYLQGTNVHKVNFNRKKIGEKGATEFARLLQATQVHTVDLCGSEIGAQGAEGFAKNLQGTRVHTVDLSWNKIGNQGVEGLTKHLQATQIHTINLSLNQIGDQGAIILAKHLQGTRVHTIDLSENEIRDQGAEEFAKLLQGTQIHTIDLSENYIYDQGIKGFAKHLQGTQVHTVYLRGNEIEPDVQSLLVEQFPHIKWGF
jgi:predicted RNA-binding protein